MKAQRDSDCKKYQDFSRKLYNKTGISIDPGEIYSASLANKELSISAKLAAVEIMKMAKKLRTALRKKRVVKRLQK